MRPETRWKPAVFRRYLAALDRVEPLAGRFDLAIIDLRLPDLNGMDILRKAPDSFPDVPVIIITGYSAIPTAVEAIKMGALDYIAKPFTPDEMTEWTATMPKKAKVNHLWIEGKGHDLRGADDTIAEALAAFVADVAG